MVMQFQQIGQKNLTRPALADRECCVLASSGLRRSRNRRFFHFLLLFCTYSLFCNHGSVTTFAVIKSSPIVKSRR
jgi:hypothetical protein